jgi:hypothetical protein
MHICSQKENEIQEDLKVDQQANTFEGENERSIYLANTPAFFTLHNTETLYNGKPFWRIAYHRDLPVTNK